MMKNNELDMFQQEVKSKWGTTSQYTEYIKNKENINESTNNGLMEIFKQIGKYKELDYTHELVQKEIKNLQDYISKHYYTCTNEILYGLGKMYISDTRFKDNIDKVSGIGTAEFVSKAIEYYCNRK